MFQRECARPPPKILISSVSEDRSAMSPPFRPAATRSWSSEDFLADSPHMENISSSKVEDSKEPVSEVLSNSTANSPQLSHTHSPTGSSVPASVTGDSAINSPDSWVESEFGVMPEKFCESTSDSSLCDSGTAWDVYRATPVEVSNLDEGFVPSMEDKAPDKQSITESYIDEGIYSLSSLESTQEQNQGHPKKKQVEVVKEKGAKHENCNQYKALERGPDQSDTEITKEVDSKLMDTSILQRDEVPRKQEFSFGLCDAEILANPGAANLLETNETNQSQLSPKNELPPSDHSEELVKQTSLEESTYRDPECLKQTVNLTDDRQNNEGQINGQIQSLIERNNSDAEVENECQKTCPLVEDKREDPRDKSEILEEMEEEVVETPEKASEGDLSNCTDHQRSIITETTDTLGIMFPTNQEEASNTSLEQSMEMNIPLISISNEPEEQNKEGTCDPERQDGDEEVHQSEVTGSNGTDTDVSSPQKPDELTCDSNDNDDKNVAEIPSCLISENLKTTASGEIGEWENGQLEDTHEHDNRNCSTVDTCVSYTADNIEISEAKQECEFPHDNTDKNVTAQTSIETKAGQEKPNDTFSQNETAKTQQSTSNSVNPESNDNIGTLCYEPAGVSRNMDLFYADFDRSSPIEDLVGDPIEPMDLFYPDKEEPMFTEPLDTDMQSWPSVLSVSALEPAPAAEALADDHPLDLLVEDLGNEVDFIQEHDKVNVSLFSSASVQSNNFSLKLASGLNK